MSNQLLDFTGKTVLVTGARSGIGRATAVLFARQGATVIASSRRPCTDTVEEVEAFGGICIDKPCDVADEARFSALIDWIMDTYGALDVAINNAGVDYGDDLPLHLTEAPWDATMKGNAESVWIDMRYEIAAMVKNGRGAIVNTSSVAGVVADPGMSPYVAAKHAVSGLTRAAGIEYADQGIRINAVAPSFVMSEMMQEWLDADPDHAKQVEEFNWQHRIADPMEIAEPIMFLASDMASFINGLVMPIDAGQTAH